ncbi:Hypothetical protein D9617_45g091310 [Elsinoe fawcettii]|nr:Hypothetical protein D9617_45g091310 [Elsinoe fawcettii]
MAGKDADSTIGSTPTHDNAYALLCTIDTVFLIDDSSSMKGARWTSARAAVAAISLVYSAYDIGGFDIGFLNAPSQPDHFNVTSPRLVNKIFSSIEPFGGTFTGKRLDKILREYVNRYKRSRTSSTNSLFRKIMRNLLDLFQKSGELGSKVSSPDDSLICTAGPAVGELKPLNIVVITDGSLSDDVVKPLVSAAKKLDRIDAPAGQVCVQFFQIGDDQEAAQSLMSLKDKMNELASQHIRNMVDTVPFTKRHTGNNWANVHGELTGGDILKIVLSSVVRQLDARREGLHL